MSMRVGARIACTSAAVLVAALAPGATASAGSISSGPLTLTLADSPFFVKGVQEALIDYCGAADGWQLFQGGVVRQAMSATSPYGIASWDVAESYGYSEPGPWTHYAQSTRPVIQYDRDNYNADCGGGVHNNRGVIVRVTDNQRNVAVLEELARFHFTRWDNTTAGDRLFGSFSFGTAWAPYSCAACDNGSTIYTKTTGAAAVYQLGATWTDYGATAGHLGLVMTRGPGHGAVRIYLDGLYKATVDTYSSTWKYRNYVYDLGIGTAGTHTVRLVNVGTTGRPRIDVQGMALIVGLTRVPICDPDTGTCTGGG